MAAWVTCHGAPARLFQSTGGAISDLTRDAVRVEIGPGVRSGADAVEVDAAQRLGEAQQGALDAAGRG
ncbi:hypothetical protein ABTK74_19715, partial [Acinetobacter baumannii]